MTAALLALLASAAWGAADFAGGVASRRLHVAVVMAVVQVFGAGGMLVGVLVRGVPPVADAIVPGLAAGVLGAVAFPAFYRALAVGTMGVIAPILATSAVVPIAFGVVGGERPGSLQALGGALALAGVLLASRAPGVGGARSTRGVPLALLATGVVGLELVLLDRGAAADAWWTVAATRWTSCALTLVVVAALLASRRVALPPRRDAAVLGAIGVADTGANLAFAIAAATGLLSLVAVLGSLAPVVTVALARAALGERLSGGQGGGVALAMVGVALILVG